MGVPRSFVFWSLLSVVLTQRVKVRNEVTGYVGDEAMLQCLFPATSPDIKVSQVTWMKEMGGKKQNVAVYLPDHKPNFPLDNSGRIRFLNVSLQDATLIIQPLRMSDEGTYVCEFATYPHGNEDGITTLSILARPTNTAESRKVVVGNTTIPVAICTSANGKPPAHIKWLTTLPGSYNASEVTNGDGTVTVTSQFNMVPTAVADQQQITCVISQRTLAVPENIPVTLSVLYPPQVTIDGYDDNWYMSRSEAVLRCTAKGNPKPTHYSWSTPSGPLPPTVQVQGDRLVVQSVDVAVNTTFICHVTNSVGTTRVEQTVLVRAQPNMAGAGTTGGIIGGIIATIVAVAVVATGVLIFRQQQKNRTEQDNEDLDGPPAYKPPPPQKKIEDPEVVSNPPEAENIPLKAAYFEPSIAADPTELDLPQYHELPTLEDKEPAATRGPSLEDEYLDQINPIYDALSFASGEGAPEQGFIMSRALYV
ncbi:nectin-2 isoform X1 [Chelonoidis abingdonii]|uniref:nectin-2 isoform X1 n=1 Tax=Chelonoidis abingdonii TaxID=106734 RepID=UPI0013F289E6|nr:nectin-2 isoform X1 [Chelonoidis abingdonii]